MSLLVLSASDVKRIASSFDPKSLQELMAKVFIALSSNPDETNLANEIDIQTPHRTSINITSHTTLFMPARLSFPQGQLEGTTIKIVSVPRESGDTRGLPATTLVLDEVTGAVEAVVNARELTALRNAAGSLLSATLVGISEPENVVMFGAGAQIEAHIDLFVKYYKSIRRCIIVNRNINERAKGLHHKMSNRFPKITFELLSSSNRTIETIKKSVEIADIIICATSSTSPLFPSSWVSSGTHVILIGSYKPIMQEVEEDLIRRALPWGEPGAAIENTKPIEQILLVDSRKACLQEAGDLIKAEVKGESMVEIGELLLKDKVQPLAEILSGLFSKSKSTRETSGRIQNMNGPITLFKSVGVGLQDVAMAKEVVFHAKKIPGIGSRIDNYDV